MRNFTITAKTIMVSVKGPKALVKGESINRRTSPDLTWGEFLSEKCKLKLPRANDGLIGVSRHAIGKYNGRKRAKFGERIRDFLERNYKRAMKYDQYSVRVFLGEKKVNCMTEPVLIDLEEDASDDNVDVGSSQEKLNECKDRNKERACSSDEGSRTMATEGDAPPAADDGQESPSGRQGGAGGTPMEVDGGGAESTKAKAAAATRIKKEVGSGRARIKFDPDGASIVSDLRRAGIMNENIKPRVNLALGKCSNEFLLQVRDELKRLARRQDSSRPPRWEKVVQRAPISAHLLLTLFDFK